MGRVKIGNVFPSDEYLLARCAPTGYGLGAKSGRSVLFSKIDTAKEFGLWTIWGDEGIKTVNNISFNYAKMLVVPLDENAVTQMLYPVGEPNRLLTRSCVSGVWGEWESDNPPMEIGKEYRTTERYMGKPVYTMLFDMGQLANNGENTAYYQVNSIVCAQKLVESHVVITDSYGIEEEDHDIRVLVIPESTIQYGYKGDKSAYTGRLWVKYTY